MGVIRCFRQPANLFKGEISMENESQQVDNVDDTQSQEYEEEESEEESPQPVTVAKGMLYLLNQHLEEPKVSLSEIALKAVPKGSFRVESVKKKMNETHNSDNSIHSQFVGDEAKYENASVRNIDKRNTFTPDSNYLNFTNRSFKKVNN